MDRAKRTCVAKSLSQMCFLLLLFIADFGVLKISKRWKFVLLDQFTWLEKKKPLISLQALNLSTWNIPWFFQNLGAVYHCKHLIEQTCKILGASTISVAICRHKMWNLAVRTFSPPDIVWFWRGPEVVLFRVWRLEIQNCKLEPEIQNHCVLKKIKA